MIIIFIIIHLVKMNQNLFHQFDFSPVFQRVENKDPQLTYLKLINGFQKGHDNSLMIQRLCQVLPHSNIEILNLTACYFKLAEINMIINVLPSTNIVKLILEYTDIDENGLALLMTILPQTCVNQLYLSGAKQIISGLENLVEVIYQTKLVIIDFDKYFINFFPYTLTLIPQHLIDRIYLYLYNSNINRVTLIEILTKRPVNINDKYPPYSPGESDSKAVVLREAGLLVSMNEIIGNPQHEEWFNYLENYNIFIIHTQNYEDNSSYKGGYFSSVNELRTNFDKWSNLLSDFYTDIKLRYNLINYPHTIYENANINFAIIKDGNNWKLRYYIRHFTFININTVEKPEISSYNINIYLKQAVGLFLVKEMERFESNYMRPDPMILGEIMAGLNMPNS